MEQLKYRDLKRNMIVNVCEDDGTRVNCIVLPVTKKDIKLGLFARSEGWYGFRCMNRKGHPTQTRAYSKMYELSDHLNDMTLVRKDIVGLNRKQLQEIL